MEEENRKNYFFCSYFWHISLWFYSNFNRESFLDVKLNYASNKYALGILLTDPATPKTRNTWKNVIMMSSSCFSSISCFWGSGVHQKYALWVLVGCRIKLCIQSALSLEIWVKSQGDMLKIRKKVVFFYDKYVNSTIMVDSFYWNSIGSWIPTHKIYFWHVFL